MRSRLDEAWKKHRRVMVQMLAGTGKTHLMAAVIRENAEWGNVLVVAHRIELIEQIASTLHRFGIEHGLTVRNSAADECQRVMVASIQTLAKRIGTIRFRPGLVVVDEAHHALEKT